MRENKRKLNFKKIKIANINSLKGGDDTIIRLSEYCPSGKPDCPENPGSDIQNPCSDGCLITAQTCPPNTTGTLFGSQLC